MSEPTPQERELRLLLDRVVPQLPMPAQRLERIKARARVRRRRRQAGLAATAVAAVALAGLTLPGGVRSQESAGVPAGTSAALTEPTTHASATRTEPPTLPPTRASTTDSRYDEAAFPDAGGVTLALPPGWYRAATTGTGYVATQPLAPAKCLVKKMTYCSPLAAPLRPGGVLVLLVAEHNAAVARKADLDRSARAVDTPKSCRVLGGSSELEVLLADASQPKSDVVVTASICMAPPTGKRKDEARALVLGAKFT